MGYFAFVPARSGSKRLPHKNVKPLAGKPLLVWTLEACAESVRIDKVILSTDSDEYWETAQHYLKSDKLIRHRRTATEAGDKVKIFDYLQAEHTTIFPPGAENFVLALPTVPFRNSHHVDEAIALSEREGKPVFSATAYGFPISFAFYAEESGAWTPVFGDGAMVTGNTRSQDQRPAYHPNGAIYVRRVADLAYSNLKSLYQGAVPYLMDRTVSFDIDSEVDFAMATALLESGLLNVGFGAASKR